MKYFDNESNEMILIQLSNKLLKNRLLTTLITIVYFNFLFVLHAVNSSSQQVRKDHIVWLTESRTPLQHHSFVSSIDKEIEKQTS